MPACCRLVDRLGDDRGLVLELVNKHGDVLHNDTGRARRRVVHLHNLDARREVHAKRGGIDGLCGDQQAIDVRNMIRVWWNQA